jgi:hypothetical protein
MATLNQKGFQAVCHVSGTRISTDKQDTVFVHSHLQCRGTEMHLLKFNVIKVWDKNYEGHRKYF